MANPPTLLDADGAASMATAFMLSHHALRRDLARFRAALDALEVARVSALVEEWGNYHGALHGHHEAEDLRVFPALAAQHAALASLFDKLGADHRKLDPVLDRGDRAFAELPSTTAALALIDELSALLEPHLALEEAEVIPFLRDIDQLPTPQTEAEAEMFADGFAWTSHGIAHDVVEKVDAKLSPLLRDKLPAARARYQARCDRVWGPIAVTQSRTPVPGR